LAIRRAVAAICALALLVVTFAHSHHDFDNTPSQVAYGVSSVLGTDDGSDNSNQPGVSIDHCHGCVMTAVVSDVPAFFDPGASDLASGPLLGIRSSPPSFENPPPISAI